MDSPARQHAGIRHPSLGKPPDNFFRILFSCRTSAPGKPARNEGLKVTRRIGWSATFTSRSCVVSETLIGQSVGADDRVIFSVTESALATNRRTPTLRWMTRQPPSNPFRAEEKARAAARRARRVQNAHRGGSVWVQVGISSLVTLEDMRRVLIWGNSKSVCLKLPGNV